MSKTKSVKVEEEAHELETSPEETPVEFTFLTNDALYFRTTWNKTESPRDTIPPQTPNSEYGFEDSFRSVPSPFPSLTDLEVPYVREKGVKLCIEVLGEYFGCTDYKFNLLQFWFLDVVTDCLWRAQDDFRLPTDLQKTVLAWVLYFLDILRDPQKNISRKKFFTIFKEAILIAAEIVDEGCDTIPTPEKVFTLIEAQEKEEESESESSSDSEFSSSSIEITAADYDNVSCIELEVDGKQRIYELPKEVCTCDKYDLSSIDTATETVSQIEEGGEEEAAQEDVELEQLEDIEFYQADLNIPARFLPLPEEEEEAEGAVEEETEKMCKFDENVKEPAEGNTIEDSYKVLEVPDKFCVTLASLDSSVTSKDNQTPETLSEQIITEKEVKLSKECSATEKVKRKSLTKEEVLKSLAHHKLWAQRLLDMDNPKKGWIPTGSDIDETREQSEEKILEEEVSIDDGAEDDDDWVDVVLKKRKYEIGQEEDMQIVNFGVLWAITDFIFKYFYESFQFSLIKLAFHATPDIITQKVNKEWKIPKKIKQQFQRPKEVKPKKEKLKKEKKAKGKKDKKGKDGKKDKKAAKEPKKKAEKSKKVKPVPLTKEQKAELDRQRKEKEKIEEELRKIEENKRFLYPLTEAATDDLFKGIFENWVKVDLTKQGKGKGKGKGKKK